MRTTRILIAIVTFACTLLFTPSTARSLNQHPNIWLFKLHMLDAQNGWAQSAEGMSGNVAKGAFLSVVRTVDGGIRWKDVRPSSLSKQRHDLFFLVQALTPQVAWGIGSGPNMPRVKLFNTLDGGQTWKSVTLPQGLCTQSLHFVNPGDGWAVCRNDIYHSADSGMTWNKIGSADLSQHQVDSMSVSFLNATRGWIGGFRGNGADEVYQLMTRDGGRTWQRQVLPLPEQFKSRNSLLVVGSPKFFSSKYGILVLRYHNVAHSPSDESGVLVFASQDAGMSWKYTTSLIWKNSSTANFPGFASSSFADFHHGWVTDTEVLHITSDGGRTWAMVRPGLPFEDVVQLEFISPRIGWATGSGFSLPFLLKTVDGGRVWKELPFSIRR